MIEILNRYTRAVLYSSATANDIAEAVREMVSKTQAEETGANLTGANLTRANLTRADLTRADLTRADLTRANLTRANLTDANLTDADLTGANLTDADLTGANLTGANLTRADLTRADLTRADLTRANLTRANLTGANLTGANLTRADLTRADLTRADLTRADLTKIRDDFWAVLCSAPAEVSGLRLALVEGRVDGSTYSGSCACLVGTIANLKHCSVNVLPYLAPNSARPAERFFLGIDEGDTPETNAISKQAVEWIDTWKANMLTAFDPKAAA